MTAESKIQHIDFTPCAGLANRLRAIASAMSAAQEFGATLCVYWKLELHMVAPFSSMLDALRLPSWVQVVDVPEGTQRQEGPDINSEEEWESFLDKETARGSQRIVFKSWAAFYDANAQTWPSMARNKAAFQGHPMPYERWLTNLRSLKFLDPLVASARAALAGQSTVGVHIRRQDHIPCRMASPSAAFWNAMAISTGEDITTHFYVASDDMDERREALRRFPVRALVSPQPYRARHTLEGAVDGAVEFLTLSMCKKILGSFQSSFSEVAALYGGIPFVAVRG